MPAILCSLAAWFFLVGTDPPPDIDRTPSPDTTLWLRVLATRAAPPTTQPYTAWLTAVTRQRQELLERVRLYLALYPGGGHRGEAVELELAALFETGCLRGGALDPLRARAQDYARLASDDPDAWRGAWWSIVCLRAQPRSDADPPKPAAAGEPQPAELTALEEYISRFPRSPRTPRVAAALGEYALRTGDEARLHTALDALSDNFPDLMATQSLVAQARRERAIGQPFWLEFDAHHGGPVDTRAFHGRPVLVVVWRSGDGDSRQRIIEVECFRRQHPVTCVAGVNLDLRAAEMLATAAELDLDWPQYNDGLGPANRFAREWGVRRVPRVFVIDPAGRLLGSTEGPEWHTLALAALAPGN